MFYIIFVAKAKSMIIELLVILNIYILKQNKHRCILQMKIVYNIVTYYNESTYDCNL